MQNFSKLIEAAGEVWGGGYICCVVLVAVENFNFIEIVFHSKGNLWQKIFLILKVATHKYWD